ncbi:carboxypeptidase-like regulatory domain-containing protein [Fodinibius sp. AD559]|uniref:carboxypeptidase-like regulatory domain-containing protein n=1 Tax=Fodinibius sp. AD559 TaxID=3424179 RepID=UPI004046FD16
MITVQGSILDAENGEPISYAHIRIPAKYLGTASGLNGAFKLNISQDHKKDTLQVSAIGYHTEKFALSSISNSSPVKLRLQPKTYQMKSITVTDAEPETKWIGKKIRPVLSTSYGRNIEHEKIGAAYAFKIKWGAIAYENITCKNVS